MRSMLVAQLKPSFAASFAASISSTLRLINYATSNGKVRPKLRQVAFASSICRQTRTRTHSHTHTHSCAATRMRNTSKQQQQVRNVIKEVCSRNWPLTAPL